MAESICAAPDHPHLHIVFDYENLPRTRPFLPPLLPRRVVQRTLGRLVPHLAVKILSAREEEVAGRGSRLLAACPRPAFLFSPLHPCDKLDRHDRGRLTARKRQVAITRCAT